MLICNIYQIGLMQYEFFVLSISAPVTQVVSVDNIDLNLRVVKEVEKRSMIDYRWMRVTCDTGYLLYVICDSL